VEGCRIGRRSPALLGTADLLAAEGPAKSVADLVALAKKSPKGLTIASQGVGAGGHLLERC
jgi:tripartite-type tricarboxylate transporter receptor subunit TctC